MNHQKRLIIIVTTVLLAMLVAVTGFSHGADNAKGGNGNGVGHSNPNNHGSDLLGCQRNNPERLDCSSLEVTGYCEGGEAVFVIRNTGEAGDGDMLASTEYRIVVNDEVVESGEVLLEGGATMEIRYDGGGIVTLYADQQVGHPGNSHPQTTLNCAPVTPEPEPTDEVVPPAFDVEMVCEESGNVLFTITNSGGDMLEAVDYAVTDGDGIALTSGWLQLNANESFDVSVAAEPLLTLRVGEETFPFNPECSPAPDPTEEPTPDEQEPPALDAVGDCEDGETARFIVTNYGGAMTESAFYVVYDNDGGTAASGEIMLGSGESVEITANGYGEMTLVINEGQFVVTTECYLPDPTEEPTPDEQEPPALDAVGDCEDGETARFIVTNYGGAMTESAFYVVYDNDGGTAASGEIMLGSGESVEITANGYGEMTLVINEGQFVVTVVCTLPDPTEEPTPDEQEPPALDAVGDCEDGETARFIVTNYGGAMTESAFYVVYDNDGGTAASGEIMLGSGESTEIAVSGAGEMTLVINEGQFVVTTECYLPDPTEEPTPDEQEPPALDAAGECVNGDTATFFVTNYGGAMTESAFYVVYDNDGGTAASGEIMLGSGESTEIAVSGAGEMTLVINEGQFVVTTECYLPDPTEEPTPDPTEEPTPDPTEEPTPDPTEEPTPDPTEEPPLGCQGNNPDRLDCSSLEVTGYCDGNVAVFTIRNTGEPGNGDMRAPTAYTVVVDGVTVESGSVQINGGATMEVRYEGGGTVTLYADQQVGHPGNSHPQTTLTCGS